MLKPGLLLGFEYVRFSFSFAKRTVERRVLSGLRGLTAFLWQDFHFTVYPSGKKRFSVYFIPFVLDSLSMKVQNSQSMCSFNVKCKPD